MSRPEHLHLISPQLQHDPQDLNFLIEIDQGDLKVIFGQRYSGLPISTEFLPGDVTYMLDDPERAWKNARRNKPQWAGTMECRSYDVIIDLRRTPQSGWAGLIVPLFYYLQTSRQVTVYAPVDNLGRELNTYLAYARQYGRGMFRLANEP